MMKTFDFEIDRRGVCRVFRNSQRHDIIAVCKSVFDAMTVVEALESAEIAKHELAVLCEPLIEEAIENHAERCEHEVISELFNPHAW